MGDKVNISADYFINNGDIQAQDMYINADKLHNLGGTIEANNLNIVADSVNNISGKIYADNNLEIKANSLLNDTKKTTTNSNHYLKDYINNIANIRSGGNLQIISDKVISIGSNISSENILDVTAKNLSVVALGNKYHVATSGAKLDRINHLSGELQGMKININSDSIMVLGSNIIGDTISIKSKELSLTNVKDYAFSDVEVGSRGSDYYNRKLTANETNVASNILANNKINLDIGENLIVKASNIHSPSGDTNISAGNISIINDKEYHELLEELHKKDYGLLSSKTTDIYNHHTTDSVVGSNISSGSIKLNSDKNILIKASNIVADKNVNLIAKDKVQILSDTEKSTSKYVKQVKKSGIFSNGGLSITIGKQKQTDSYDNIITLEKGSTIGSNSGNVNLQSNGATEIKASGVLSYGDINVNGSKIDILNGYNTRNSKEKHEFEKSGLTVSLSNNLLNTATDFAHTLQQSQSVRDQRLKALLQYKAYDDADKSLDKANFKEQAKILNLNLALGTEKYFANSVVNTKQTKNSNLLADGNIKLTTNKEDINILGSNISGKNINLNSAKDIDLHGSENTTNISNQSKAKSTSIGLSYDLLKHNVADFNVSANGSAGSSNGVDIIHQPAIIKAAKSVAISSDKDVNITDGRVKGAKVFANIGGSLNIKSVQDIHNYTEDDKSGVLAVKFNGRGDFKSTSVGIDKKDINSDYKSVVNQSGIYAGQDGFDIKVRDTTKLVGSVLASATDNNSLKTKNLVMDNIENKAKFSYDSQGLSYLNLKDIYANSDKYHELGLLPNILPGEQGATNSTTYSAIALGNLEVENSNVDINTIRRNTETSLNRLNEIFDKQSIDERQQTARLFSQYANEAIHVISDKLKLNDGSGEKIAFHSAVGAITAAIAKGNVTSGAIAGGLNEALINEISKLSQDNPTTAQWISYILGYATDKLSGDNGYLGAGIAQAGTKWNHLKEDHYNKAFLIMDRYPSLGHIAILFSNGYSAAVIEYDSLYYGKKEIITNGLLKKPVQGIVRQQILDNPNDIKEFLKKRVREVIPLKRYNQNDIRHHIRYVNNIMDNSLMAKGIDQGTTFYNYLQYIDNSSYGRVEFYPGDGWKNYVLTERNCVIFATTPVMADKYGFDRLKIYTPSDLYKVMQIYNIRTGEYDEKRNNI